jgi:hypothetical protein
MGSGWKDWEIGEVVEASEFQSYVQDQVVQYYGSEAARSSAIGTPTTGMVSFVQETGLEYGYLDGTGGRWENIHTGGRNVIINGAFDIWQRGTAGTGGYLADRWTFNQAGGGVVAQSQQSFTAGTAPVSGYEGTYFLRANITTAYTDSNITQRVEDVRTLAGQTATVSFFAKGPASSSLLVRLSQNFGSGGSASVSTTAGTANLTTAWQRFQFTVAIPSISGKTLGASSRLETIFGTGSQTGAFDLWGVQLEAGSVATPFRRHAPSLQGELAACKRYYWRSSGTAINSQHGVGFCWTTDSANVQIKIPTTMRTTPTSLEYANVIILDSGFGGGGTQTLTLVSTESGPDVPVLQTNNATGFTANRPVLIRNNNNSSGYIAFGAEL